MRNKCPFWSKGGDLYRCDEECGLWDGKRCAFLTIAKVLDQYVLGTEQ